MAKKKRSKKRSRDKGKPSQKSVPQKAGNEAGPEKKKPRRRVKPVLLFVCLLFIALAAFVVLRFLAPGAKIKKDSNLNVLLITLDTTRAARRGCYGHKRARTPNLDGLAAAGVRFENGSR